MFTSSRRLLVGACAASGAALLSLLGAPAAQAASLPTGLKADFGTDGRVRVMLASGNLVYVGGSFTKVIDGGGQHAAGNVGVYNTTTKRFDLTFSPKTNDVVAALAVDAGTVYLGGEFTRVNGATAGHMAAVTAATGALVGGFDANTSGNVDALLVGNGALYASGTFKTITNGANSYPRANVARLSLSTGQPDGWAPNPSGRVRALALSAGGSSLFLGGTFSAVNGNGDHNKVGKVNTAGPGDVTPGFTAANTSGAGHQPVFSIAVGSVDTLLLGVGGSGGACTSMNGTTGKQRWSVRTDGDVQAAELVGGLAWCGGHFTTVAGIAQRKLVAFDADTGSRSSFTHEINSALGVWGLEASGTTLLAGGDFTKVDGAAVNHIISVN
ncbi:MAG: hypothetical protein ACOYBY_08855 [Dermatophilaceae bacterium]